MIIRHDIDPDLYLADPEKFPAVVPVISHIEDLPMAYDKIDQMLRPSLMAAMQTQPEQILACDGMGCLILLDWILTAAHVAEELSSGMAITLQNKTYSIQKVVIHPAFKNLEEITQVNADIALIQLNQAVKGVSPLPLYRQPNELKTTVTFVGCGDYGNGLIGPDEADGKLRIATNQIEEVDEQWLLLKFDKPGEATEATDLEGISGPGDRSGPALIETAEGWAIAGISAGQDSTGLGEGYYGVWEYYTRVSQYLQWIDRVTQEKTTAS